jgi:hypothetical protein
VVKGMTDVQKEACWKIVHDGMMDYRALAVLLFTATIASDLGYSNQSAFAKMFRKIFGQALREMLSAK